MDYNRRAKKISKVVLQTAQIKLDELTKLLEPGLVSLKNPERKLLVEIGDESIEFLKMSHGMSIGNPELFPYYLKPSSFEEKISIVYELSKLFNKVDKLKDDISDTKIIIGNNAMENALAFYNTLKIAARRDIPGARLIFEELKAAFPSRAKRTSGIVY